MSRRNPNPKYRRGANLPEDRAAELLHRYDLGEDVKALSQEFGLSVPAIYMRASHAGIKRHPRLTELQREAILSYHYSDYCKFTYADIGRLVGVSHSTVPRVVREYENAKRRSTVTVSA